MGVTVLSFIVVMGVLVFVHELGHFILAKRNKIVVEEFGFGYPPRLIKLFERNGTIYSINAIPFGGFVRMGGEDDPTLAGSFAAASRGARAATLLAGPVMNLLLAIVLFAAVTLLAGVPDTSRPGVVVKGISPESPAEVAGLQMGDRLVGADGVTFSSTQELLEHTSANLGAPVTYSIVRGDQTIEIAMTPRTEPPTGQGPLGIQIGTEVRPATVWEAARTGVVTTAGVVWMTIQVPATLIREGRPISDAGFIGPVGIAVVTGDVVRSSTSVEPILTFVAVLSVALGFTNLLPIPALDGGRLLFVLVEAIRRKRIEPSREGLVHLVGFGLLLLLVGFVTVREIAQLLAGTFPYAGIR